jgi:hypothetical protein
MQRRTKQFLIGGAALAAALALPAIAQDQPESILPPGFGEPATPTPEPVANTSQPSQAPRPGRELSEGAGVEIIDLLDAADDLLRAQPVPQVEYPARARRDARYAGTLDPIDVGIGAMPWGQASGKALQMLMRRMDTPLASRWVHMALRNTLLSKARAPADIHPSDWAAERAWLLLRMGEADAARLLIASVDSDRFTPKMQQVALQAALATSDPSAMCPLEARLSKVEQRIAPLVTAICASLSGESERAAADIESARRRGRVSPIDLALTDKVVGAGAESARAVTVEWEPVDTLSSWRYGLATATAMMPPERLVNASSLQTQAWLARAPMFSATQRLPSARTAAALGVFSTQALTDLYAASYDATDPDTLAGTEAWQLRLAFVGRDLDARLGAMRTIWGNAQSPLDRVAAHVLLARAARHIAPDADIQSDAPDLVASLLASGFDQEAARWGRVLGDMDDDSADRVWAMLAVGAPTAGGLGLSAARVEDFAGRDDSEGRHRTALLVAGLAGLGRIDANTAGQLNREYRLGLGGETGWTRMIDGAMRRRQAGTSILLTASALQGREFEDVEAIYLFHAVTALRRNGQEFLARMIAAEALSRT